MPAEAAQTEAKQKADVAGPVPDGPVATTPSFGSSGTRSHENAILRLQQTAGNRAVTRHLENGGGVQRAPNEDKPVMLGPSAQPELNGVPVNPNSLTGMVLTGKYGPPPPRTVDPPKPQIGRPQDQLSALAGGTDAFGPPIGTTDPNDMTYTEAEAEMRALAGWISKRRQSSAEENRAHERLNALNHRIDILTRPAKPGGARKAPKPRSLTGGIDWARLTDEDAAKELDAIVEYVHQQTPTQAERKKLADALDFLEDRVERQLAGQEGDVRRRDLELALTSTKGSPHEQFADFIATVEGIKDDPENPGQGLLRKGGLNLTLSADEVGRLKMAGRRMVAEYTRSAEEVLDNGWQAYTDRVDKAIDHPIVHGLVKLTSRVKDLDYMAMFYQRELGRKQVLDISKAAMSGNVSAALQQAFAFEQYAHDFANRIAKWEERLISSAKHWAIALIVLKEALTLVATGGAAGLMAFKLAKGISFVRATLQITGGLTAAGAVGAAGGSTVAQLATKGKVSGSETLGASRVGGGTGFTIGVLSAAAPAKEAAGLAKGASTFKRVAGGAAIDTAVTGVANIGGAAISDTSIKDAALGSLSAPVTSVLGEATKPWAGTSKLRQGVAAAGAGGTGNLLGAVAAGKNTQDTIVDVGKGMVLGAAAPHIASASKARNERIAGPLPSVTSMGMGAAGPAGANVGPRPVTSVGMGAAGPAGQGTGPRTSLGMGAAGPAGEGAGPRTQLGMGDAGPAGQGAGPAVGGSVAPARGQGPGGTQVGVALGPKPGQGPGGTQVGVPAGPGPAEGPGGTRIGVPDGPGGSAGSVRPVGAEGAAGQKIATPGRGGGKSPGRSPAPKATEEKAGFWKGLKAPDGPPPGPPLNEVYKMFPHEAETIFWMTPEKVTVNDSTEFHQYRWEVARWSDGRPTTEQAPMVFRVPDGGGHVMVDGQRWLAQGLDPTKILKP